MINSFISRLANSLRWRIEWLYETLYKLFNTVYYWLNKKNILVVNASYFQILSHVRAYNLGDDLNYHLIKALTGKKILAYNQFYHKVIDNYMCIGSVIDWLSDEKTIVWGSGILDPNMSDKTNKVHSLLNGNIKAVRGSKTRQLLLMSNKDCPEIYGDPALLLPLIYNPQIKPIPGRVGIIPHYKDLKNINLNRLLDRQKNAILIDVKNYKDWHNIIDQIASCEYIISSSLHGLIISDAYNVPNLWVSFSDLLAGGQFKFEDYYSSVGKTPSVTYINFDTSWNDLLAKKNDYRRIKFDSQPLLKSCPFEICESFLRAYSIFD